MSEPSLVTSLEPFDSLATMVAVATAEGQCCYVNATLEDRLGASRRALMRGLLFDWLHDVDPQRPALRQTLRRLAANDVASARLEAVVRRAGLAHFELPVHVIFSQLEPVLTAKVRHLLPDGAVLVELVEIELQARSDREERLHELAQANKELVRNLAHEIKNPLGGIRGSAQLLELELSTPELHEYTQVIIREADRLQLLVDRLLDPHRQAHRVSEVNIHEVLEHVRRLMLAEFPRGLHIERDYDTSLPEFRGDREHLIQVVLNIVRNAAEALAERIANADEFDPAVIVLRSRIARQVTIHRQRCRLALELHIQDNGPGVPEAIRERIFHPLVSGRDGGSGLGLTLAQSFIEQHQGTIECDSVAGQTIFKILIPLP